MKRGASIYVTGFAILLGAAASAETRAVAPLPPATGMSADPSSRLEVLRLFQTYYRASEGSAARMAWTGNSASGIAGTTSAAYKDDVLRRINFYRALSGYPSNVVFDATKSAKSQQAALMMSANNKLDHSPPKTWRFYSADGAEAAANSNLTLGNYGPEAIDAYMQDEETGNEATSHRRWLLYSFAVQMGTGDIPANNDKSPANSLWVTGPPYATQMPADFACFPNEGYCPASLAPARWSISFPGANFANAKVVMKKGTATIPTKIISDNFVGSGDSALVWTPTGVTTEEGAAYTVTVTGITGTTSAVPATKAYTVTFFDPDNLGQAMTLSGPGTAPGQGAPFTFTPIAGADAYQVEVSQQGAGGAWTEGAEDTPPPQVIPGTTGNYALRETAQAHSGTKSFHLVFPAFVDQFFTISRAIIPQATSHLLFYQMAKITTPTNILAAEISQDGGTSWTAVWQRNGIPNFNASETGWTPVDVNLAAYAGKSILVRFAARYGSSSYTTPTTTYGFYIDDVSVSNTLDQSSLHVTELPGNATSFTLNADTAGVPLADGANFQVRIRPGIGSHWFDYTAAKQVTIHITASYADWVSTFYPSLTGGFTGDGDKDGITNGVEYAFALNPLGSNSSASLPQAVIAGNIISFDYDQPDGITDLDYEAEWSDDLVDWNAMPDTGAGNHHHFQITTLTRPRIYFRHVIEQK
ncbi:MAG: hypothetical protein JWO82_159 [Akkermansiaceae bacterium]|nr:hypothetical protein [Akkermansiaceae bacterium]